MEGEVGIYSMFFLYKKSIFCYQKIILYKKNEILLLSEIDFLYQEIFSDIKNIFYIYKKNEIF